MNMTSGDQLRRKLHRTVETIGDRYFVDATEVEIGATTVEHWKILMGTFAHVSNGNALLVGEPGTGKTTFANVLASATTELPFDLFARTQIQGHHDQTKQCSHAHTSESSLRRGRTSSGRTPCFSRKC